MYKFIVTETFHIKKPYTVKYRHYLEEYLGQYYRSLEGQNVRNFPYPVRIRWSRKPNLAIFIYITGYLNVRKISEMTVFRTFVVPLIVTFFLA